MRESLEQVSMITQQLKCNQNNEISTIKKSRIMKLKKTKWMTAFLTFATMAGLQAGNSLNVHEKSNANTAFATSDVQKLTFAGGNLTVNKKDATTSSYARTNVAYLNFTSGVMTAATSPQAANKLALYPSPVQDVLNIELADATSQAVQVEIVSIDGKTAVRTVLHNAKSSISVASLPKGIYLCRCTNGNNTSSTKFIKQ